MLRAVVTSSFLLLAVVVLWMAFVVGTDTSYGTLFINLGTEIIGIVITVAVVEWFFERRRLLTRGRQLAWDSLHATQTAVWVWQGGPREMETDELLGVLNAVHEDDPLPDFTEGLFLNVGTRSRRLLNNDPQAVAALPGYMDALERKKVWVHCIVNARVSAFLFCYLQKNRGLSAEQSATPLLEQWLPQMDKVWKDFISQAPAQL